MENKSMCGITTNGYKMKDGSIIPFKKLNMGDVSPEHIEELNKSVASVWDVVLLRNTIFGLKDEISKDVGAQIERLSMAMNKEKIKELVHEEINNRTDLKIKRSVKIFDLIWKAAVVLIVVINIYLFIKGRSPIQITP